MPKYNHLLDVGFTVISDKEDWEELSKVEIISAMLRRIDDLVNHFEPEAFGYSDTYEEEDE